MEFEKEADEAAIRMIVEKAKGIPRVEKGKLIRSIFEKDLAQSGVPPALPGWQPQFDNSGSPERKLPLVSRQSFIERERFHEQSDSEPHRVGVQVPRSVHPEVPQEGDFRTAS